MQKLTVTQFRRYCEDQGFNRYTYDTNRQPWDTVFHPIRIAASYPVMATFLAPASVCFKNDSGTLCLESVKYVLLSECLPNTSAVFTVVCRSAAHHGGEIRFVIDAYVCS